MKKGIACDLSALTVNWKRRRFISIGLICGLVLTVTILVVFVAVNSDLQADDHLQTQIRRHLKEHSGTSVVTHILDDPIKTDAGYISGTMIGDAGKEVRLYRGIPYAAPPLGDLRWRPPQPVTPWSGIRECTAFCKWSPQKFPTSAVYGSVPESGMSEDCLYLNVLTPAKTATDRLPVLVWFHPGGFTSQSASWSIYNEPQLPQHGVVLVTVSHRLGAIGYLAHPLLTAESPNHASGNYGQLDLVAALKWVQKNIAAFGGDPNKVTIFGESGGGYKVTWLMASPLARGLFQRAIAQSGVDSGIPLKDSEQMGVNLASKLGITGGDVLAALRGKTWQEIINASLANDSGFKTATTIDGWSLLDSVQDVFKAGQQTDVPFIIQMTEYDIPSIYLETIDLVRQTKQLDSKMYVSLFTHVPTGWHVEGCRAFHSIDVGYVFGICPELFDFVYQPYAVPAGAKKPDPGLDDLDDWMTEFMMQTWVQFAATGTPHLPKSTLLGVDLPMWPPYDYPTNQYLEISVPPQVKPGFPTLVRP